MESAAVVSLGIDGIILGRLGMPWHAFTPALWLLPVILLFYFLDALLFTWFSELTTMQIQMVGLVTLWFVLQWAGAFNRTAVSLHHFTPLPVVLPVCIVSLALAAATVWRLDQRNY